MYGIKSRRLRSQNLTCFAFLVLISLKKQLFKNVIVEEELDCIDIDDIGNLEDSPRLVFINEECGNLIVVNDDGELTRNISQKKSDVHSVTCRRE